MEGTSSFITMTVECIIFYVDPNSVGSLNLWQCLLRGICRIKGTGLRFCVELKFCSLEKGKDGSKAFAINTRAMGRRRGHYYQKVHLHYKVGIYLLLIKRLQGLF